MLIGKRKDKKDKGYATLEGESSPEEENETKLVILFVDCNSMCSVKRFLIKLYSTCIARINSILLIGLVKVLAF